MKNVHGSGDSYSVSVLQNELKLN